MKKNVLWVVFRRIIPGHTGGVNAVCPQDEWDAMESAHPGVHQLVRAGIASEGEAEQLARGTSGDSKPRLYKPSGEEAAA